MVVIGVSYIYVFFTQDEAPLPESIGEIFNRLIRRIYTGELAIVYENKKRLSGYSVRSRLNYLGSLVNTT